MENADMAAVPKPAAPALTRGIRILQALQQTPDLSLDDVCRQVEIPKSSALRLLETLVELELIDRDPVRKTYAPRALLVPLPESDRAWEQRRSARMDALVVASKRTVEWYVFSPDGMVLIDRRSPREAEVQVRARIGFLRAWGEELDAVAALGYAFAADAPPVAATLWEYDTRGTKNAVGMRKARARVAEAEQERALVDALFNPNGVRRIAAAVLRGDRLVGVLALAELQTAAYAEDAATWCARLREEADAL